MNYLELFMENYSFNESKKVLNDENKEVPKVCPKCGSKIGIFFIAEPVYLCTNKKCKKYFGTAKFTK